MLDTMTVPFIQATGNPYEIGHSIGRAFPEQIAALSARVDAIQKDVSAGAIDTAVGRLVSWSERLAPHLLDEMRGYADGADVPLDTILRMNSTDEARAQAAQQRAAELMAQEHKEEADFIRAEAALRRSMLRLKVAKRKRRSRGPVPRADRSPGTS